MAARFPPPAVDDTHVSFTVQRRKSGQSRPTFCGQRGRAFGVSLNGLPTANHDPASSILGYNTHGCVEASTFTAFWPSTFYNTPIVMPVSQFDRVPDTIHAYQWFQPCFHRMKGAERSIAMPPGCTVLLLIGSSASDRRKKAILWLDAGSTEAARTLTRTRTRLPENFVLLMLLWAVSRLDAAGERCICLPRDLRAPANTGSIICIY